MTYFKKWIAFTCLFVLLIAGRSFAQKADKNAEREGEYLKVQELINSKAFEFNGIRATTQKGLQVDLLGRINFLIITGESAKASMPYFGAVTGGGYSDNDGGINFDGEMTSYTVKENDKKRRVIIEFKSKNGRESYTCSLTINSLNSCTLAISSINRSSIPYFGSVKPVEGH